MYSYTNTYDSAKKRHFNFMREKYKIWNRCTKEMLMVQFLLLFRYCRNNTKNLLTPLKTTSSSNLSDPEDNT